MRRTKLAVLAAMPEGKVVVVVWMQQEAEATLLPVIKALVERIQGVRIPLERGAARRQRLGPVLQVLNQIERFVSAVAERVLTMQGGKIAIGLLERGPCLFLLGRQPQADAYSGDARIQKGGMIFRRKLASPAVRARRRLLGVSDCPHGNHKRGGASSDCLQHYDLLTST
jgi:hypothetical protein